MKKFEKKFYKVFYNDINRLLFRSKSNENCLNELIQLMKKYNCYSEKEYEKLGKEVLKYV